ERSHDVSNFHVFGCHVFIHNHKDHLEHVPKVIGPNEPDIPHIKDAEVPDVPQSQISNQASISSHPVPHGRRLKYQHIKLVNIISDPGEGMLTRSIAAKLTAALASEYLFGDFLSKIVPKNLSAALKHPRWVDAMHEELNQFYRNKKRYRGSYVYFAESGNYLFLSSTKWVIDSGASDHMKVSRITSNLQCSVKFYPEYCVFKDLKTKKIIGRGRKCDGLYVFEPKVLKSLVGLSSSSPFEAHCRLDHTSLQSLKKLCVEYSHLSSLNCDSSKGYAQTYGIDYSETFSPVIKISSIQLFISLAATYDWAFHQLDVKNAFLHGDIEEKVYMEQPLVFLALGIKKLKSFIGTCFQTKDLRSLKYFLGIKVSHSSKGICLSQRKYRLDLLDDAGNPVFWKSKKQNVMSRSSSDAKYRAMAQTTCELVWLRSLLDEIGFLQSKPMKMWRDNQAAIYIVTNPVFHERTKHIEMVNPRTDTDLTTAVQNALQALLPQIREEIRQEFRT
nr:copia protein [Tanacetum cinerariifolium]